MSENNNDFVLQPGKVLGGNFRIEKVLGTGGFGITYKATDLLLDRVVAIKEFYPGAWVSRNVFQTETIVPLSDKYGELFQKLKKKFVDEARIMAKLESSPYVVNVYSYFEENATAYIVMEFLSGIDLRVHVEEHGQMEADEICRLMLPLMRALDVVHSKNLIHRDISPDNIMLMKDENGLLSLKLMDFGAARSFSEDTQKSMTVILKHGFAPFEQYQSHGEQGAWTDIYALSASMYFCITGIIPETATDRANKDLLKRPSECDVSIRPGVEDVLMKGLALRPEDRYRSAEQMAQELESAMHAVIRITDRKTVLDEGEKRKKEHVRQNAGQVCSHRRTDCYVDMCDCLEP